MELLRQTIEQWVAQAVSDPGAALWTTDSLLVLCSVTLAAAAYHACRRLVLPAILHFVKHTSVTWDDILLNAQTLRHICLDKLRLRRDEGDVEQENPPPGQWPVSPPADGRLEAGDQLRYLLAQLPSRDRRIVRLRHIGAYSTQEISRLTGETEANVRVILSRARQKLRQCMLNEEYQSLARTQPYEKRT